MGVVGNAANDFASLLERYHAGDTAALASLYSQYGGVVREAVRRRLPDRLRREYDSLDFVQDVWASFCVAPTTNRTFETPEDLGGYLAQIAYNKVIDVCRRRFSTKRYDANREVPMPLDDDESEFGFAGPEPTPSQWAIAGEKWAEIASSLPTAHVVVIERIREGFSQQEVARMAGITPRTVRRIVERVRELCEESS